MPPPTLFDDEGEPDAGLPPPTDGRDPVDAATSATDADVSAPNYLARRAIVVGAAVAVIAVAAIVVGRFIGSGDDGGGTGAASSEWNRVVLVQPRTGEVVVHDESGDEVATIDSDVGNVAASHVIGATALVVSETASAIVALDDEVTTAVELAATSIVEPSGSTLTMVAPATTGSRGLLVHGPSGDTIDTDEFAPVTGADYEFAIARTDPSGRHVLVTDSGNFQSVLFSFDRDEPSYFPGLALAVDDSTVVTAQNIGTNATINVFDHDGEPLASGRTTSVRAAMLTGDTVRLVTVDGQVVTMDLSSGDTEDGDELDIGTIASGEVLTTGDRLVVTGTTGSAIVDDGGSVVHVADATPDDGDGALRGSTCVALTRSIDAERELVVVDARDGSTIAEAEITGDTILRSADGCTVAVALDVGYDVIGADGVTSVGDDLLVAFAPNGQDVIVERNRTLVLTPVDPDEEIDPVELGTRGPEVSFTET